MPARLMIADSVYVLSKVQEDGPWIEMARLQGGAQALLPAHRPVDAGSLEVAIQIAEDWLMPHARSLRSEVLEVVDETGRLRAGMDVVLESREREWTVETLEQRFLQLVDLATGRVVRATLQAHRSFAADLLLLRELAHHGAVRGIRLT